MEEKREHRNNQSRRPAIPEGIPRQHAAVSAPHQENEGKDMKQEIIIAEICTSTPTEMEAIGIKSYIGRKNPIDYRLTFIACKEFPPMPNERDTEGAYQRDLKWLKKARKKDGTDKRGYWTYTLLADREIIRSIWQ